jgi:hypothetical protein
VDVVLSHWKLPSCQYGGALISYNRGDKSHTFQKLVGDAMKEKFGLLQKETL